MKMMNESGDRRQETEVRSTTIYHEGTRSLAKVEFTQTRLSPRHGQQAVCLLSPDSCLLGAARRPPVSCLLTPVSLAWPIGRAARPAGRQRGMILLLVVAILVLLALMGTAYVLMARSDKQATYAANSSANINLAQKAILNVVRSAMLNQTLDSVGTPFGLVTTGTNRLMSRNWDYPEIGTTFGIANGTTDIPDEPWLVSDLPWEQDQAYIPGQTVMYNGSRYVAVKAVAPSATAPATGSTYWSLFSGATASLPNPFSILSLKAFDPATGLYDIPYEEVQGYNTGTNPYTIGATASAVQPSVVYGSTYPYATRDAIWNLLPYSDPNGMRYRFAIRVMDLSSRLNLNTGWVPGTVPATTPTADTAGQFLSSMPLYYGTSAGALASSTSLLPISAVTAGEYGSLINGNSYTVSRTPNPTATYGASLGLQDWQAALFSYELPTTALPTTYLGLPSCLDLVSYGTTGGALFGPTYFSRATYLWPATFGINNTAPVYGSPDREFYTTYSWSRNYLPSNGVSPGALTSPLPYTFNGTTTWQYPRVVPVNSDLLNNVPSGSLTATAPQILGQTATNLATAVGACGFTGAEGLTTSTAVDPHAKAMAVNYLTYRAGQYTSTTAGYSLPAGPSWLDTTLHVRAGPSSGTAGESTLDADYNSGMSGDGMTYVGFAAQPFINEMSLAVTETGSATTVTGWAVELFNPFPANLSLANWNLEFASSTGVVQFTVPLGTLFTTPGIKAYIAASNVSFNVVQSNLATQFTYTAGGQYAQSTIATLPSYPAGEILITRPLYSTTGTIVGNAVVDEMPYSFTQPPAGTPGIYYYDIQRDNTAMTDGVPWGCDSAKDKGNILGPVAAQVGTLGTYNTPAVPGAIGIPLYDRFLDNIVAGASIDSNYDLQNMADFNCISRLANISSGTNYYPISIQIADMTANPSVSAGTGPLANFPIFTNEQYQADAYFDFAYDPRAAWTSEDTRVGIDNPSALSPSILSMISLVDRASDQSINVGEGLLSVDKTRIPGRVNINTAPGNVLLTAFSNLPTAINTPNGSITMPATSPTLDEDFAADILAYRDRITTTSVQICQDGAPPTQTIAITVPSYSGTYYAGYGIRSIGDMLLSLLPTVSMGSPADFLHRDEAWASIANFCTVRSDSFVVYGVLEALRLNENYSGGLPATANSTDWYTANQGIAIGGSPTQNSISTDPDNVNAEFILEGTRRFVGIVDRSYCNLGPTQAAGSDGDTASFFQSPKVMAIKVLPN